MKWAKGIWLRARERRRRDDRETLPLPPGFLLVLSMLLGALIAEGGLLVGAPPSQVRRGGRLVEYRGLNLDGTPIVKGYVNMGRSFMLTAFTRVISPTNSLAIVTIYGSQNGKSDIVLQRIDSRDSSWARWAYRVPYPRIRVKVEDPPPGGATPATRVDVLLYLGP